MDRLSFGCGLSPIKCFSEAYNAEDAVQRFRHDVIKDAKFKKIYISAHNSEKKISNIANNL
jgi:hypothetical protein